MGGVAVKITSFGIDIQQSLSLSLSLSLCVCVCVCAGWIMYIGSQGNNDEGTPTANSWCVGYATSDQLDGPWTSGPGCIIGSGNASGYQAEGFVSFSYKGLCALCKPSLLSFLQATATQ